MTKSQKKLRLIRNHGMVDRDTIPDWGYNSRLDSIQAAILNVKMSLLKDIILKRRKNVEIYRSTLKNVVTCPSELEGCIDANHVFAIQCDKRDSLKSFLEENGISSSIHYPTPLHLFECSRKMGYKEKDFPVTEEQSRRILSLPVHQNLSIEQIEYTANKIVEFYSLGEINL